MVTGLVERGVQKCARYWPAELFDHDLKIGDKSYGDVNVSVQAGYRRDGYITSDLLVKVGTEERSVKHFWFNPWPDHGVPAKHEAKNVTMMLEACRKWSNDPNHPWTVHCSAGIGRTGTFIGIDHGMHLMKRDGRCCVLDIINKLRVNRGGMVQHYEQMDFVLNALLDYAETNNRQRRAQLAQLANKKQTGGGAGSNGPNAVLT